MDEVLASVERLEQEKCDIDGMQANVAMEKRAIEERRKEILGNLSQLQNSIAESASVAGFEPY